MAKKVPSGGGKTIAPGYVVVARRYRPQGFDQLIGQQHVTQALGNAIQTNRVGHAYLFTGARGVGKTSAARIFAKALNCVQGPTTQPCNECDICEAVGVGEDVDVIEIDGASNRGIDEIRQLRANVGIRPSRARCKVYIIDEVHMLTKEAFNALLKTLEEPPDHVKFIFCTTDPEKIPITVLSRCQRFDFAPIANEQIVARLQEIVDCEGAAADAEALELLARRAAGSMRDSQSLLEQLLAFSSERITVKSVHAMLGTADVSRIRGVIDSLAERDTPAALLQLDQAIQDGVDVGQFIEQLVGYLRDVMAVAVGSNAQLLLHVPASEMAHLRELANRWGLQTVLAVVQILDQTLTRMRQSLHGRTLAEVTLIRVCQLPDLDDLAEIIEAVRRGELPTAAPAAAGQSRKKKLGDPQPGTASRSVVEGQSPSGSATTTPAADTPPAETAVATPILSELTPASVQSVWNSALNELNDLDAEVARQSKRVELVDRDKIVVTYGTAYNAERCRRPEQSQRMEGALRHVTGRSIRIDFVVEDGAEPAASQPQRAKSTWEKVRESYAHPMVKKAVEIFDAEVTRVQ